MSRRECAANRVHTVATGAIFVVSGVALLGTLRGWWNIEPYWAYWPLVFLVPAITRSFGPDRSPVAGLAWAGLAAFLVSLNLGYVHLRLRDLVPLLLVGLGARLLFRARTNAGGAR
jgi:hypothetical protein